MPNLNFDPYKANLSFGQPGWQNTGSTILSSGGQGMPIAAPIAAAGVSALSTLIGGALGAGGKKKDRKHQMDMLMKQIAAAEKMQTGSQDWQEQMRQQQWGEQERRFTGAAERVAPEQGFIPTYQSLKESNPMLQKFFGGQMQKLFGGANAFGLGDVFSTMEAPEYTGFEQEQSYAEKAAQQEAAVQDFKPVKQNRRVPQYFRDRYQGRGGRR